MNNSICTVCGKPYKHYKWFHRNENGLKEFELITAHAGCRSLLERKQQPLGLRPSETPTASGIAKKN